MTRALRRRYGRAAARDPELGWAELSEHERRSIVRWYGNKYGLTADETRQLVDTQRAWEIQGELEWWRAHHGLPAHGSGLTRGALMTLVRGEKL